MRSTPAIIPLEPVMPLADPRTYPKVDFLDLVDPEEIQKIEESLQITELLQQSKEESYSSRQIVTDADMKENTEDNEIKKSCTSRPADPQVQDTGMSTRDPDTEIMTQSKKELKNAETRQDTEISIEIYPEIYPETRFTAVLKKIGPGQVYNYAEKQKL